MLVATRLARRASGESDRYGLVVASQSSNARIRYADGSEEVISRSSARWRPPINRADAIISSLQFVDYRFAGSADLVQVGICIHRAQDQIVITTAPVPSGHQPAPSPTNITSLPCQLAIASSTALRVAEKDIAIILRFRDPFYSPPHRLTLVRMVTIDWSPSEILDWTRSAYSQFREDDKEW